MVAIDATDIIVAFVGLVGSIAVVWIPLRWGKHAGAKSSVQSDPDNDHAPASGQVDLGDRLRRMRLEMHERFDLVERRLGGEGDSNG